MDILEYKLITTYSPEFVRTIRDIMLEPNSVGYDTLDTKCIYFRNFEADKPYCVLSDHSKCLDLIDDDLLRTHATKALGYAQLNLGNFVAVEDLLSENMKDVQVTLYHYIIEYKLSYCRTIVLRNVFTNEISTCSHGFFKNNFQKADTYDNYREYSMRRY